MKLQLENLRQMKDLETQRQADFFQNCKKIINLMKVRQSDKELDEVQKLEENVRAINTDVQAFKNLRSLLV